MEGPSYLRHTMPLSRPIHPDDRGTRVSLASTSQATKNNIDIYNLPKPPSEDSVKYRIRAKEYFSLGTFIIWLAYWPLYNLSQWYFVDVLGVNGWIATVVSGVAVFPCWWFAYGLSERSVVFLVRDVLRFNKHCASCCFSLADIPIDADGSTVCPECGAAWKLPD